MADCIKTAQVNKVKVDTDNHDHVLIIYDVKQSEESMTHPHDRTPLFRSPHMSKLVSAVQRARGSTETMRAGDVFLVFDAFKHGNDGEINKVFKRQSDGKTMDKVKRVIYIHYDQKSIAQHRGLSRGATVIHQLEFCTCYSAESLKLGDDKDRLHFPGTNKGDAISP